MKTVLIKINLIFYTLCLVCFNSQAAVNMRNGSYTESWVDFIDPKDGYEIKIERFYSSRSLFDGLFGYGWCSFIETKLDILSDGSLELTECGGGLRVAYYPENFDSHNSQKTSQMIVEKLKVKKKLKGEKLKKFKKELISNTKMRFEYALKLGLIKNNKIKSNISFQSRSKGMESIFFDGLSYQRKKFNGTIEKFNRKGKLIRITNPLGNFIRLEYRGQRLSYLIDNRGKRLNFIYNKNGKLSKIYNGRGHQAIYQFKGDNLVSVKNIWGKVYNYSYDNQHNLSKVVFPDKTSIKMTYDLSNDWIKTYTNRRGCQEAYTFLFSDDDPKNHYLGKFIRDCKNEKKYVGLHEFWYKNYDFSKDKYLDRVHELLNEDTKKIQFHPYLGRPVSVKENELNHRTYSYFINGLLNIHEHRLYSRKNENKQETLKIISWLKFIFKYNLKERRMTQAEKLNLKENRIQSKTRIFFSYNKKGLLTKVHSLGGNYVSINYNSQGKIVDLKNQNKVSLSLIYQPGRAKPSQIIQKGVGKVLITYDSQGEVESVKSDSSQRHVASSVIDSFLQMLDFLGPIGERLKL